MPITPYGERVRRVLQTAVKTSGVKQATIEGALGMCKGYLSQIFSGRIELKVWHLEVILEQIAFDPQSFFRMVYPHAGEDPDATSMEQFAAYVGRHTPVQTVAKPGGPAIPPELRSAIQQLVVDAVKAQTENANTAPLPRARGAARSAAATKRKRPAKK